MNMTDYNWDRLKGMGWDASFVEKMKDDPCWRGYEMVGKKTKNGKKVPNCVPVKKDAEHSEGDEATAEMTPNYLPKEPGTGPAKDPSNSKLAMQAAPNYSEEDFFEGFHSGEANGAMAINQLRVMREKIDIMLGMLYPDDNLEPWMATKLTMSAQNLASVADYLRFGVEL